MGLLQALEIGLGALLVLAVLRDLFQSIVTPRPTGGRSRLSRLGILALWRPWRWASLQLGSVWSQEGLLAIFGPLAVLLQFVMWVALLILGYGLILHGMRTEVRPDPIGFGTALYFAATSMLTIGFGDIVAVGAPARIVAICAGATGLGMFAVVISFLFSLVAAFQRREVQVVTLEAAAGAPPSGVSLLESHAVANLLPDLPQLFQRWQQWSAEVLDSHLSYPVLAYFRSSHDNDSWISSLGAVMDAAILVLTTIRVDATPGAPANLYGWAKLSRSVGSHCIEDLAEYFGLDGVRWVGVELEEFRQARERLAKVGYVLNPEDESWERFQHLRGEYAGRVSELARYWASPPAQWIGDRSPLRFRARHAGHVLSSVPR